MGTIVRENPLTILCQPTACVLPPARPQSVADDGEDLLAHGGRRRRLPEGGDRRLEHYDDYMDPIAMARLLGRAGDLAAALTG